MGAVVGAVASGNVPADGNGAPFSSWLEPLPLLTGAMFVASGAYLSAVFLIGDARRSGDEDLAGYFARRALAAATVAGIAAAFGLIELHAEARYIFDRLIDQGLPLVILSALCGIGVAALLVAAVRGRSAARSQYLRPLAAGAVIAVIWGWGVAQFPYLLPTSLKITQAASPPDTLAAVIIVFIAAAILVLPALGLLYWLSQKELLGE
jgi:cytochrome d ubiquinol oxidase subunit II